jgi:hypothetical protein
MIGRHMTALTNHDFDATSATQCWRSVVSNALAFWIDLASRIL